MHHEQPNHTSRSSVFLSSCVDDLPLTSVSFPETSDWALYQQQTVGQGACGNLLIFSKVINIDSKWNPLVTTFGTLGPMCVHASIYRSMLQ